MTRKDYEAMASAFKVEVKSIESSGVGATPYYAAVSVCRLFDKFCRIFALDNACFDRERFEKAAAIKPLYSSYGKGGSFFTTGGAGRFIKKEVM